jgi:membrane-bound lytic murein transglycosylase D
MRTAGYFSSPAGMLVAAGALLLAGCATTVRPQQFRTFLLPPATAAAAVDEPVPEPPRLSNETSASLYVNEVPFLTGAVPDVPRPSDADFLLKKADDSFLAGKLAFQAGKADDARRHFNLALEALLSAPENLPDRPRLERRLEELIDEIYRLDVDKQTIGDADDQVSYDKSPRDSVLDMTFPVDPALRNKVKEQIQATASQLPLEENDAVLGVINFFSTERGKKIVAAGIRRSGRYKSMIEQILAEEGVPQELIFVAQAESGFLPRALSNKACVGLWQFAKFRGKEYGLQQTSATDDRMDPEKATRAAARHLHDLYTHLGDWYLAMAAYDCGPGCVDHAVLRTGYADFWELRRLNVLPKETSNYVPVILAMTIMAKNAKDYGLDHLELEPALEFDTVELQTPTHIALVADAVDRPLSELRELNPALLRSVAPAGYSMHVPKGTLGALETAFRVVPSNRRDSWRLHRVQMGETLAGLAKRYSAPTGLVGSANHEAMAPAGEWMAIPVAYPGDRNVGARKAGSRTLGSRTSNGSTAHKRVTGTSARAKAPATAKTPMALKKSTTIAHAGPQHKAGGKATPASTPTHRRAANAPVG